MSYKPHPLRVQRKRTKGYRLPAGAVVVTRPTKWGNMFRSHGPDQSEAVELYRLWVTECNTIAAQRVRDSLPELRGKQLACYCPLDKPCHADVLAELANK